MVNNIRGWMSLSFPDICLTVESKARKNLNQENWPDRGSNPGPLVEGNDIPRPQRWSFESSYEASISKGFLVHRRSHWYQNISFSGLKMPSTGDDETLTSRCPGVSTRPGHTSHSRPRPSSPEVDNGINMYLKFCEGIDFEYRFLFPKIKSHNLKSMLETSMKLCSMYSYYMRNMCAKKWTIRGEKL